MVLRLQFKKDEFNRPMWLATSSDKDNPDTDFFCRECTRTISSGYICENKSDKVQCKDCQLKDDMMNCKHDDVGEHRHIKWVRS